MTKDKMALISLIKAHIYWIMARDRRYHIHTVSQQNRRLKCNTSTMQGNGMVWQMINSKWLGVSTRGKTTWGPNKHTLLWPKQWRRRRRLPESWAMLCGPLYWQEIWLSAPWFHLSCWQNLQKKTKQTHTQTDTRNSQGASFCPLS